MKLYCKECQQMKCNIGELVCEDCKKELICSYCGKMNVNTRPFSVWVNGIRREMRFCSGGCASYYQMGAEG